MNSSTMKTALILASAYLLAIYLNEQTKKIAGLA